MDLSLIPMNVISAFIAFAASYSVMSHKVKLLEAKVAEQKAELKKYEALRLEDKDNFFKVREKDERRIDEKFQDVDFKREKLKDTLVAQMHTMDKKITEIHAIIVNHKNN